jgi:hypothetical protein
MLEVLLNPKFRGTLLQQCQQVHAANAAEPVPATEEALTADVDRDVIPMPQACHDGAVRRRISRVEVLHGLIGEHNAPAKGIRGSIALINLNLRARQRLFQKDGRVESGRAAAYGNNAPHSRAYVSGFILDVK